VRVEARLDDDEAACLGVRTPRANEEAESSRYLESLFSGLAKLCVRHGLLLLSGSRYGDNVRDLEKQVQHREVAGVLN
jgi:hypothetical protein